MGRRVFHRKYLKGSLRGGGGEFGTILFRFLGYLMALPFGLLII